jgi:hypothetical protein
MKQIILPQEGDLLFEKKSHLQEFGLAGFFSLLFFLVIIVRFFQYNFKILPYFGVPFLDTILIILAFCTVAYTILVTCVGMKNGFSNETYKAFYFSDKIIFYRISNYLDEIYTQKKNKAQILQEIIRIKDEIAETENELSHYPKDPQKKVHIIFLKDELKDFETGLNHVEKKGQPHKSERYFKTLKYFINETNEIKIVLDLSGYDDKEEKYVSSYELSKKYKKSQSEIVDFLNQRIKESKKEEVKI